ncbi:MAG: hypothetical protein RLZZ436_3407 [Planctomycetota bacterium]|jgi:hypothetical protein
MDVSRQLTGKQIRIYLTDGDPAGVLTAEIINWTGKIVAAPRSQLRQLGRREDVQRTGVYVLAGPDPTQPHRDKVYIGEADHVFERLKSHDRDVNKDFWTRIICVISKDDNITKSHARYLESCIISRALEAGRATVANDTSPPKKPLPEADITDMEYFLQQMQLVFPVLGLNFLVPVATPASTSGTGQVRFVMTEVGAQATAVETTSEFVVLRGSTARKHGSASWDVYVDLRRELLDSGKLVESPDPAYLVFTDDVPFSSPSAAAAVVAAGNRNGRTSWKVQSSGQTYGEWRAGNLEEKLPEG